MSTVTTSRISDPFQLPALAHEWDDLIDDRTPGAVFRSSDWLVPWWRYFSHGRELSVYVVRRGPVLLGALPAYRVRSPLGGRRLRLLGDWPAPGHYLGVIARPNLLATAVDHIAGAILADEPDVLLEGILVDDPLVGALRADGRSVTSRSELSPYIAIDEKCDFNAWIKDRPGGLAGQLRRRRRWLERRPGFGIEVLTQEDELAARLPVFWHLHRARWSSEGLNRSQRLPQFEQFHIHVARALARRGSARLYFLHSDGAPRAAVYGFERGGRFLYYQSGRDPDWQQRSVGTVLLGAVVQDAFERGLTEFDLLRGGQGYKSLYASSGRRIATFRAAAGPRARTMLLGSRAWQCAMPLAATLPPPLRRRLRTWAAQVRRPPAEAGSRLSASP